MISWQHYKFVEYDQWQTWYWIFDNGSVEDACDKLVKMINSVLWRPHFVEKRVDMFGIYLAYKINKHTEFFNWF